MPPRHFQDRLYEKGHATKLSAITIGIHLLSIGKATVSNVDEPFQVIGISKEQVWTEPQDKVKNLAEKITRVNNTLSKLITSTPDLSLPPDAFDAALKNFEAEVLGLRKEVRNIVATPGPLTFKLTGFAPTLIHGKAEKQDDSEDTKSDGP